MPECPNLQKCNLNIDSTRFKQYCLSNFNKCWYWVELHTERLTPSDWKRAMEVIGVANIGVAK